MQSTRNSEIVPPKVLCHIDDPLSATAAATTTTQVYSATRRPKTDTKTRAATQSFVGAALDTKRLIDSISADLTRGTSTK